ncbi:MAG TPA: NAD-dependent epimerase/dehydratase family protein [Bryobacteraceae bacterium]|nr:NAD-dependent epimerase/dehydratase family protein [Bryobacteraceae bacterium]
MKFLVIGATGFIGPYVVSQLQSRGHEVGVFGRNKWPDHGDVTSVKGDRNQIGESKNAIAGFAPEVVVDMILSSGRQARELMDTVRGIAKRVVAISSADVYRACGILHDFEEGPLQPVPLTEDSQLRTKHHVYPPETIQNLKKIFGWLDDEYDKIPVERTILSEPDLPGTVLRLPMVYGPGDRLHRFWPYLKRMDDNRPAILIQEGVAQWRAPRGYVENVAAAIALAAADDRAAGRIFNVAEPISFSEEEWAHKIAAHVGWHGEFVTLEKERMPTHLQLPYRSEQHWTVSTDRIRHELGYVEPVSENSAFERTIAWERKNPSEVFGHAFDYAAEDQVLATLPHY